MTDISATILAFIEDANSHTFENDYIWKAGHHYDAAGSPFIARFSFDTNRYANHMELNLKLKSHLHGEYLKGDTETQRAIIQFYIQEWGGVRSNKTSTISHYVNAPAEKIMEGGSSGVASWSKALCIRDPDRFAIYDARVSIALNAMQLAYGCKKLTLFPMPPSRSRIVKFSQSFLITHMRQSNAMELNGKQFYASYLQQLAEVGTTTGTPHSKIEMLLFAKDLYLLCGAMSKVGTSADHQHLMNFVSRNDHRARMRPCSFNGSRVQQA